MTEANAPTPEEVLVELYRALQRLRARMRASGAWPEGEAIRVLPRGGLDDLEQVPADRVKLYPDVLPELIRRGWAIPAGDLDLQGRSTTVDLTQDGQEHARQLIGGGAV
jgi:hypothetical protein